MLLKKEVIPESEVRAEGKGNLYVQLMQYCCNLVAVG
jgi:hypothetical protein